MWLLAVVSRTCHRHRGLENSDRKSTRLNSSHLVISYAVFCLKKKKNRARLVINRVPTHHPHFGPHFFPTQVPPLHCSRCPRARRLTCRQSPTHKPTHDVADDV